LEKLLTESKGLFRIGVNLVLHHFKLSKEENEELDRLLKVLENGRGRIPYKKDSDKLKVLLKKTEGTKCRYCGIEEEEFIKIWRKPIYKKGTRRKLEIEHRDGDKTNNTLANLALDCPICNIAKSDQFTEEEFMKVGKVIREIWQQRKDKLR